MGLLSELLGKKKRQEKPYIDSGLALINKLVTTLNLSGWKDLLPEYTPEEIEAIDRRLTEFQKLADKEYGGEAKFHKSIVPQLQRMFAGEGLAELATSSWNYSEDLPINWKDCVATYLKLGLVIQIHLSC
jgi:hypothetical protein